MTATRWNSIIAELPPGLSAIEAARRLGKKYLTVRYHLERVGYQTADGRKQRKPGTAKNVRIDWSAVDWSKRDAHIAKESGIGRESVRQMRARVEAHKRSTEDVK
jgi:hypothetical protein